MYDRDRILEIIDELDNVVADDLEDQYLDFKEFPENYKDLVRMICESVVCFANGRGGSLVLGIRDKLKIPSKKEAVRGVPEYFGESEKDRLGRSIYDSTDPHLTPEIEWLDLPEGKLLLVTTSAGQTHPYTSSQAPTKRRVGKNCLPVTGGMMRDLILQSENVDFSSRLVIDSMPENLISAAEMERLRSMGRNNRAPNELMDQPDLELLGSLRLINDGRLTYAGLLLVGKSDSIRKYIPNHEWRFLKMKNDTDIEVTQGKDSAVSILTALERLETYIAAYNPVTTFIQGFYHNEFKTYPDIAIREAVLNAFVHRDYTIPNLTIVRMIPGAMEIDNAGGFMSDINPNNILHHPPVHRNRLLADALNSLNLVNRNNLGVKRMYKSMLEQGKEPPTYHATPQTVSVNFRAQELDIGFLELINWLGEQSASTQDILSADMLLILHRLRQDREISLSDLANMCQSSVNETKRQLGILEHWNVVEHNGYGKGTFYRLSRTAMDKLGQGLKYDRDLRLEEEALKVRILTILKDRKLTNAQIREISDLDREKVKHLMDKLRKEGLVQVSGRGMGAYWFRIDSPSKGGLFGVTAHEEPSQDGG